MSKKKTKKDKKPNIPIQTMARPRLEHILVRREQGELDDEEYIISIEKLMAELGPEPVLNALVGLLDNASNERREALMIAIPKLGNEETIAHLWQLVRRSQLSLGSKMTALVILKGMGEEVNLEDPGEYFSWRDVKQSDLTEVEGLARYGTRALVKELQKLTKADDVEAMMWRFEQITSQTGGEQTMLAMIEDLVEMAEPGAADMLMAISATTPHANVRQAARTGLLKLSGRNVFPQSEAVKSLTQERFYAAYTTDPANPWQQGVMLLWERSANNLQALVFLLDFGHPWKGALKDMFPTQGMTMQQIQRDLIDRAHREEVFYRRTTYARARQFILAALEANKRNKVKLPEEYYEFRHLLDRRIIDPSPETLAYAAQVDAKTVDEWGELEGEPVRGLEIISPDGRAIPLFMPDELADEYEDEEEGIEDLSDLLFEVEEYYYDEYDEDEEEEEEESDEEDFILPYDWTVDYLTSRYDEGVELEELEDRWLDLSDFMIYLDEAAAAPETLEDLQGAHLSEFITHFWDEEIDPETPVEEKTHVIETIRDLYGYLAAQGHLPAEVATRVAQAADSLLSRPGQLTSSR